MNFTKRELQKAFSELIGAMLDAIDALEEDDPETALDILYDALWLIDEEENENPAIAEATA